MRHLFPATGPSSLRRGLLAGAVLLLLFFLPSPASAQTPEAVRVEAETIVYDQATQRLEAAGNVRFRYKGITLFAGEVIFDLAAEHLTARGRVRLIDAQGREMRGEALSYDLRLGLLDIERAQAIIDRMYVSSERIQGTAQRIVAQGATATTCDPARPAYRITAKEIELIPGDHLTARQASVWLGSVRLLTLPALRMSMRSGEETARSLPRAGYSSAEGVWVDYLYYYDAGSLRGGLYTKYASRVGLIPRNFLRYETPAMVAELTIGRNQDVNSRVYEQAEVTTGVPPRRLGASAVRLGGSFGTGWFREPSAAVETTRSFAQVDLSVPSATLGARATLTGTMTYRYAWYGTGAAMGIVTGNTSLTYRLSERTSFVLSYRVLEVASGATPFQFDTIPADDLVNEATALLTRSGFRLGPLATTVFGGVSYDFRTTSPSLVAGFSGRDDPRLALTLSGSYNLKSSEFKVTLDAGAQVGLGSRVTVYTVYNTRTGSFEEFDYGLTARLCDCFQVVLKYRQARKEFWLEVGLAPNPTMRFPGGNAP